VSGRTVLSDLDDLSRLTSDDHGVQRVAWTEGWMRGRRWLEQQLALPGVATAIAREGSLVMDLRHRDPGRLAALAQTAHTRVNRVAEETGLDHSWEPLVSVAPTQFHEGLSHLASKAINAVGVESLQVWSGALHDAVSMARAGVPTALLFVRSSHGSHVPEEASADDDVILGVHATARLVEYALSDSTGVLRSKNRSERPIPNSSRRP
jgi:acetylornithine deacetylase/succinyl-diaminopimelate desuccinylase-like protein